MTAQPRRLGTPTASVCCNHPHLQSVWVVANPLFPRARTAPSSDGLRARSGFVLEDLSPLKMCACHCLSCMHFYGWGTQAGGRK